jgi:hypothetical protein
MITTPTDPGTAGAPTIGLGAWIRSLPTAATTIARGEIRNVDDRLGQALAMSDGRTYVPFRNTIRITPPAPSAVTGAHPAVLQARFHLEPLRSDRARLHAFFRAVCISTTPFFVGLPGFRSKFWMVDPATGDFAGLYEWDSIEAAAGYERGLRRIRGAVRAGLRLIGARAGPHRCRVPAER